MAAPELSERELAFLEALDTHRVRFMMVGLGAAALQGAFIVTQDVDLWFENLHDPNLRAALKDVGASYVPPFELNPPMFAGGRPLHFRYCYFEWMGQIFQPHLT